MHQTGKGNLWRFGMKAHIGVAACTGLTHRLETTPANAHDLNHAANLLHGRERFADAGYRGIAKRPNLKGKAIAWYIAERPGQSGTPVSAYQMPVWVQENPVSGLA